MIDNPYTVAQKWLARHELPDTYVDQIVEFIDKSTSGVALGGPSAGSDPFTGAASYRPGNTQNSNPSNVGADPFTGAGSYQPSGAPPATGKMIILALKIIFGLSDLSCIRQELSRPNSNLQLLCFHT